MSKASICVCGLHAFRAFEKLAITGLVDADQIAILDQRWYPDQYDRSSGVRLQRADTKLHHEVLPGVKPIDHINRNPADCRRTNLRETTPRGNILNSKDRKCWKHPTGARGVYKQFRGGKVYYAARVHRSGKSIHVGYFSDLEAAKAARAIAALAEYGVVP